MEADSCPDCGQPWSEATDPANEFDYQAELLRCHACTTGAKTAGRYRDQGGDARGLHINITRRG
ncbi:hypothetical protein GCM10010406_21040 [Streptomyces thermolineatus]|uniref:Uncharacterized protein n=1 Tax=Streptomyces thermolineatus TaxID=44033 RepID=A0ABP5YVN0_9ACTN